MEHLIKVHCSWAFVFACLVFVIMRQHAPLWNAVICRLSKTDDQKNTIHYCDERTYQKDGD